jgi:dipeptidyl aminopeptidase/acylaminoacyl peptidase
MGDYGFSWSPDSSQLIFTSQQELPDKSYSATDLFLVNVDGSEITRVTETDLYHEYQATWSPDGTLIYYTGFTTSSVSVCPLDPYGLQETILKCQWGSNPVWSPDGTRIAYRCTEFSEGDICVTTTDGSQERNLTRNREFDDRDPAWSP